MDVPLSPEARLLSWSRQGTTVAAILVALLGATVLLGWYLDIGVLKSLSPGWASMKPNTALAFLLSGCSLWLLREDSAPAAARRIAQGLAGLVALLGAVTLAEYGTGWNPGVDTGLFPEPPAEVQTSAPGRMAPVTALNVLFAGSSLLCLGITRRRGRDAAAQVLALPPMLLSLLALIGYGYGVEALYRIASFTSVAAHTALGFVVLSTGILLARPSRGWMRVFMDPRPGGILLRRLVPFAVGVPILLGWLRLAGQHAGLYGTEFGLALMVVANMASILALAWWLSASLNAADSERARAETEVRQLNAELERRVVERTRELENLNQELEAFSYSVSHDLRAPLRAIDGWAQALVEDHGAALGEGGRMLLERQRAASQRMGLLIDELLLLARLSRQPLVPARVEPGPLVRRVWSELCAGQGGPEPEFVVGDLPVCEADPLLLEQVFTNLLDNARKFSGPRPHARVEVGCNQGPGGECVFFVRDNGAGFDMRYANRLFAPFQRLHSQHEFPGTGIGLVVVQRIIHRHGGRVWAEAAVNQGATFSFTLPSPVAAEA